MRRCRAASGCFALGGDTAKHTGIDSKTLRGSRRHDATALHIVSAFATEFSVVVCDHVAPPERNEIAAAPALLRDLPLEDSVIAGDAIFCQREIYRHNRDKQGHDLLAVKQNQPEPRAAIAESIGDLTPFGRPARKHRTRPDDATTAETIGKAHGRLEFRRAEISAEVMAHLGWPDAALVRRIERTR